MLFVVRGKLEFLPNGCRNFARNCRFEFFFCVCVDRKYRSDRESSGRKRECDEEKSFSFVSRMVVCGL